MAKGKKSLGKNVEALPQLFPIQATSCAPKFMGGVDSDQTCHCEDGHEYVVKLDKPDLRAAHNEWMCASLAHRVGLRCPPFNLVKHADDGKIWFGSQWLPGEVKDWWLRIADFSDLVEDWSRIYAFDLFDNNSDRHLKNLMCMVEGGKHVFFAIDHSRAWLFGGMPMPRPPVNSTSRTSQAFTYIKSHF